MTYWALLLAKGKLSFIITRWSYYWPARVVVMYNNCNFCDNGDTIDTNVIYICILCIENNGKKCTLNMMAEVIKGRFNSILHFLMLSGLAQQALLHAGNARDVLLAADAAKQQGRQVYDKSDVLPVMELIYLIMGQAHVAMKK